MAQSGLAHLNGVQGVAGSNPALPIVVCEIVSVGVDQGLKVIFGPKTFSDILFRQALAMPKSIYESRPPDCSNLGLA